MVKRIAIGSFMGECNPNAPPVAWPHFEAIGYREGEALLKELSLAAPAVSRELKGFYDTALQEMDGAQLVPLLYADASAAGPIDHACFEDIVERLCGMLSAVLPLDGVYLALHGAAKTTRDEDPEATLLQKVHSVVGAGMPVVATLDMHANVSAEVVRAASALIGYRTNPHVDMYERGAEAAQILGRLVGGARVVSAFYKLPLIAPSPTHLTDADPIRSIWREMRRHWRPPILNISILTGYTHGDSPKSGMSVIVTGEGDCLREVRTAGRRAATLLWESRDEFKLDLMGLEQAVELALKAVRNPGLPALAFADTNDNPGGGARGNTIWALKAFVEGGVEGALIGALCDPALARAAHQAGEGSSLLAEFNRDETEPTSGRFDAPACVLRLHDGECVGRKGLYAGQALSLGPSCLLQVGPVLAAVISKPLQTADPVMFEMLGVDLKKVRALVIKSRGHFRAGFDEFFTGAQIHDIDAPGLTMRRLDRIDFRNIRRPIYPLDRDVRWNVLDGELVSTFPAP
ncbi:M81 family metallopeptidase [Chelativorans xinjiangense]|uniref:M81 family metallopeptidase n=1 Tax=Chelativorans xinjiangense TaxID=2681485 RepID=UPI00135C7F6F|nr:M81 family metallopeptidase [Chelativorans xinjiangense]